MKNDPQIPGEVRMKRVAELRQKRGLTQRELAELAEISINQMNRIENGNSMPSLNSALKLARFFEVSLDYLVGMTDEPTGHFREIELTPEEQKLIDLHRRADVLGMLYTIATDEEFRDKLEKRRRKSGE